MKYIVAIVLVVVALASAETPRRGEISARQQAEQPPYAARGLKPAGPTFNLPLRSEKQQQPPTPAVSYGPPQQEYGPPTEASTTETPTTTETVEATTFESQAENLRVAPTNLNLANTPQNQGINPASLFVVVPQRQNLVYATAPLTSAKLAARVQQPNLVPVQAVPAFAKIQEFPHFPQYQTVAPLTAAPAVSSAYTSIVNTPFSYSFVQSFQ